MGLANQAAGRVVSREKIVAAFHAYCAGREINLAEPVGQVANDALEEMVVISTPRLEDWWVRNHYRYSKLREIDRRLCRFMLNDFVAAFQHGKVEIDA